MATELLGQVCIAVDDALNVWMQQIAESKKRFYWIELKLEIP
jgi:hypothetical protein